MAESEALIEVRRAFDRGNKEHGTLPLQFCRTTNQENFLVRLGKYYARKAPDAAKRVYEHYGYTPPANVELAVQNGQSWELVETLLTHVGQAFENWHIEELIGIGGMAAVYRVVDTKDRAGSCYAMKLLRDGGAPQMKERMKREAEIAKRAAEIVRGLPRVVDTDVTDTHSFYVMEHIDGESLQEKLMGGPLAANEAASYIRDAARQLKTLYDREEIIHRDLKPSNIMVSDDGVVFLVDFGSGKAESGLGTSDLSIAYPPAVTRRYLAPEQLEHNSDHRSDIYALGGTLYALLAGHSPFEDEQTETELSRATREKKPNPPSSAQDSVPHELDAICLKCLEKNPSERYQNAGELVDALEDFLVTLSQPEQVDGDGCDTTAKPVAAENDQGSERTNKMAIATLCVVAVVMAMAFLVQQISPLLGTNPQAPKADNQEENAPAPFNANKDRTSPASRLVWIEPGEFMMGSPDSQVINPKNLREEQPQHLVRLTKGFYLGETEVTQDLFRDVMGTNPSWFKGDKHPVENVTWQQAMEFCKKLTQQEHENGRLESHLRYQLPTEAQWECACRAGSDGLWCTGNSSESLGDHAWYGEPKDGTTHHEVKTKRPNRWGLHDMHGNVYEWCLDNKRTYQDRSETDPVPHPVESKPVFRGGSWRNSAADCRSAFRNWGHTQSPTLGFRVAVVQNADSSAVEKAAPSLRDSFDTAREKWILVRDDGGIPLQNHTDGILRFSTYSGTTRIRWPERIALPKENESVTISLFARRFSASEENTVLMFGLSADGTVKGQDEFILFGINSDGSIQITSQTDANGYQNTSLMQLTTTPAQGNAFEVHATLFHHGFSLDSSLSELKVPFTTYSDAFPKELELEKLRSYTPFLQASSSGKGEALVVFERFEVKSSR